MAKTIMVVLLNACLIALSWGLTCGVLFLISWCFGLVVSLQQVTGLWLTLLLLKFTFKHSIRIEKGE